MKHYYKILIGLVSAAFLLGGCAGGNKDLTSNSPMEKTAYAKTIEVLQTSVFSGSPTVNSGAATPTPQTVNALTPTLASATTAATALTTIYPTYLATNVGDLSVPDGSVFSPGEKFTKTWQLTNGGTGTWTPDFLVIYSNGDDMGAPVSVKINQQVAPGQTVDVSVNLVAPEKDGTYTGYFLMQTPYGVNFGIGEGGIQPFFVSIKVQTAFAVTDVSISAGPNPYSGSCPVSINLHAKITASSAGKASFHFVTSAGDLGTETMTFSQADTLTSSGTRVSVTDSGDFSVYVYVDTPNHQAFDPIIIPITCTP